MKIRLYLLMILPLLFDQLSKGFARRFLEQAGGGDYELIPGFLKLIMVWNKGVGFGLLAQVQNANIILSAVVGSIIIFLLWLFSRCSDIRDKQALSLIISGAIGNLIDRLRFGAVFDFVDLHYKGWSWPAFNLADVSIFIGVLMILYGQSRVVENKRKAHMALWGLFLTFLGACQSTDSSSTQEGDKSVDLAAPPFVVEEIKTHDGES